MPPTKQKAPKGAVASTDISDPRFSNFSTDPRFRLPSKKHTRTTIDKRFSRMLKDEDFSNTAKVDRYGRKLSSSGKKKALERLYVPDPAEEEEEEEEDDVEVEVEDDEVVEQELKKAETYDPARGGGFSSSEEDSDEDEDDGGVEIEEAEFPDMQADQAGVEMGEVSSRIAVVNLDWDNIRSADLMAVFSSFVPPGGKIHKISIYQSEFGKERMEREELEGPPKEIFTRKEEESEVDEEDSEDSEDSESDEEEDEKIRKELQQEETAKDFDDAALRQYQLERLRYFYAVILCSDNATAQRIYESTDGTEYLSSANFFDLRFIPEGTSFDDDKPRDECDSVPAGYRPNEFVTDALQHSKVKLTWDMDPEEATRKDAIKRAFSGSRAEIGENDLRAYLGSDSESSPEPEADPSAVDVASNEAPLSKKELARRKMRAVLGLAEESTGKSSSSSKKGGPVGDMEITFSAGLSAPSNSSSTSKSIFQNTPQIEETTAERYIRKEKERKARRKERARAIREGRDPDAVAGGDDQDEQQEKDNENEDLGFDDPFFATTQTEKTPPTKSILKAERLQRRAAKAALAASTATQRAELELLMQEENNTTTENTGEQQRLEHFDMKDIARAEKVARKSKGKNKNKEPPPIGAGTGTLQPTFTLDVTDPRFSNVHSSHEFAIDRSHPRFSGTEGMRRLVEEGSKRRMRGNTVHEDGEGGVGNGDGEGGKKRKHGDGGDGAAAGELRSLVEKVRKKVKK